MKKLFMFGVVALCLAACPVACVNDPTEDDSTGANVDEVCDETDVDSCEVTVDDVGDTGTAV